MLSKMANLAHTVAVVKVGSTSVSALWAATLQRPLLFRSWTIGLVDVPHPGAAMAPLWDELGPALRAAPGLVGVGEVGRRRPEVLDALRKSPWPVWPLTGIEEARCAWWGVQATIAHPITVLDVGGASTEVSDGVRALSWPFGAARPPTAAPASLMPADGAVVAVGGTATALVRLADARTPARAPGLTASDLQGWLARPADLFEQAVPLGLDERRSKLLAGGAAALLAAMSALGVDRVSVSDRGLTEGLWLAARMGRAARRAD
jgi:exopolyphosphatase/pppGpp-phosphohydrolase